MRFLQDLIVALLLPRKAHKPVRVKLSPAQQHRVIKQCAEINSLIQETHENLSHIRNAGSTTSEITKNMHAKNIEGRRSLRQQQKECERINGELKQISEDMRAVRANVALTSQKTFHTMSSVKKLEGKVESMSGAKVLSPKSNVVEESSG